MLIWPEASEAPNDVAAVSAEGSTVCVLIRRSVEPRRAIDDEELRPLQTTPREIVKHTAPGLGAFTAHLLDREQSFLPVGAHPQDDKQWLCGRLAVSLLTAPPNRVVNAQRTRRRSYPSSIPPRRIPSVRRKTQARKAP
jgi:hypothetical protein